MSGFLFLFYFISSSIHAPPPPTIPTHSVVDVIGQHLFRQDFQAALFKPNTMLDVVQVRSGGLVVLGTLQVVEERGGGLVGAESSSQDPGSRGSCSCMHTPIGGDVE